MSSSSPTTETVPNQSSIVPPSVREIHKNGWLKKVPQPSRSTPFAKTQKPEKMWIVFCIHDDADAFLEFYENRRSAFSHQPTLAVPLANCLHISPNIVVQENDFVFSITLENHSIKLAASTREQMNEWIDTLRGKLTELGVLSPPSNLYTRWPEVKLPLAPNRDPNSPLPPPPPAENSPSPAVSEPPIVTPRVQPPPRVQESSNVHVVPTEMTSARSRLSTLSLPLHSSSATASTSRTNPAPQSVRHSPTTFPLPVVRGESENKVAVGPPTSDAAVSPTTSITAVNAYTNVHCNLRNETSNAASAHINPTDQNGNDSNDIYEPLCLASTLNPSYVNTLLPSPTHPVSRLTHFNTSTEPTTPRRVLQDAVRDPQRPRTQSEDGNTNQTDNVPLVINSEHDVENSRPMTLKEKQVFQLCCEMKHRAGVKLYLQKQDCVNSIAFAEYQGNLWICGWKQKYHPVLYHSFHIGDRVLSVAGHLIRTPQDYNRVLKSESGNKIEFVLRRLEFGKAIAIRREREFQELGIIRDGNTAEIIEVVDGGLADRHGLTSKATSADGSGACNWVLTEINGRSLNLFFKDSEIQDRLNAVGKDISILVQPSDFVRVLKKQLRAMWNYKDYIVQ